MASLPDTIIKRLVLARYLYRMALENSALNREVGTFASINVLQDSLEIFLLAAADHLNAEIKPQTGFPQYLDLINEKLGEYQLPYRQRLININKIRVLSKHSGILPDSNEVSGYLNTARSFFDVAANLVFDQDFWTVSLIDILDESESKELLKGAESSFSSSDFIECIIECRKAFFIEFESYYDVSIFVDGNKDIFNLLGCKAPYHARTKEYIDENVGDPFDYIVLDHANLDSELLKMGINNQVFWNIWRLTPCVYRNRPELEWIVKRELKKFESENLQDISAYVLDNIIDILISKQKDRRTTKTIASGSNYQVSLNKKSPKLYKKADLESEVLFTVPEHIDQISVHFETPGLQPDKQFWFVSQYEKTDNGGLYLHGYLDLDDAE